MVCLRRAMARERLRALLACSGVAAALYFLANPYIPINYFRNRAVLRSNLGNSSAMYHMQFTASGLCNALKLIAVGTAPLLAIAGVIGAIALAVRAFKRRNKGEPAEICRRATGVLLAVPAIWVAAQCALVATGKPGEFGRFVIVPDVFLLVEAVVAAATFFRRPIVVGALLALFWITTAIPGGMYLSGFVLDGRAQTSRLVLAKHLKEMNARGSRTLWLSAEPAPYCLPPVDLWNWNLHLLPPARKNRGTIQPNVVEIETADVISDDAWSWIMGTPISWADKPFKVKSY
jgi:hypothetical protein